MSWQPQQQNLKQLLIFLRDASDPNNSEYKLANQRLLSFSQHPEYNAYLIHILTELNRISLEIRTLAGSHLKDNLIKNFNSMPAFVLEYVKKTCCKSLLQPEPEITAIVSSVINIIIRFGQVRNWTEIVSLLINQLEPTNEFINVSLNTLVLICTDVASELDSEYNGTHFLSCILPKLIKLYSHSDSHIQYQSIYATSQFVLIKSTCFFNHLDEILNEIYKATHVLSKVDPNSRVIQECVKLITVILEAYAEKLEPSIDDLINFMTNTLHESNGEDIKILACHFWIQYVDSPLFHLATPNLPVLVEYLLKCMVYSKSELNEISSSPYPHNTAIKNVSPLPSPSKETITNKEWNDLDESRSFESSDDESTLEDNEQDMYLIEDDEFYSEDSLRKRSALTLEVLSHSYGPTIIPIILNHLLNNNILNHQDWLVRESGILALGAAAEGYAKMIEKKDLDILIPFLLNSLKHPEPLVRSISSWTISTFSAWLVKQLSTSDEGRKTYFEPVLSGLLNSILDSNQRVQESACTALVVLCEASSGSLDRYVYQMLIHFDKAFEIYGRRSRLMLYEVVGTLATCVKSQLKDPFLIRLLIHPLIKKWNELSDKDTDLFPLLECLSCVIAELGQEFIQHVDPVLSRCVKIIYSTLQEQELADMYQDSCAPPNVEFLIAALDLLSGIVVGIGANIEPLLAKTEPNLIGLLTKCVQDPVPEVIKSTCTLLGDIAIASFESLRPYLPHFFSLIHKILKSQVYIMSSSVYNNALWAIGEMAMRWGSPVAPFAHRLLPIFITLLNSPNCPATVHENAVITIGRLGLACPEIVASYYSTFIERWSEIFRSVRDGEEKDSAFRGLCTVLELYAQGAQNVHL